MVAEVFKILGFSEIWTWIVEFKLQIAIHFINEPIKKNDKDWIQTHASKDQWINSPSPQPLGRFVHKKWDQTVFLYVNFQSKISIS